MQLPAELRLMVLRYLLVRTSPISSRDSYDHPYKVHDGQRDRTEQGRSIKLSQTSVVSGYHLTPSIICTCRQIFNEAFPILYNENTLEIDITTNWVRAPIIYPFSRANLQVNTGIRAKATILDQESIVQHNGYDGWKQSETLRQIATRFHSFVVTIDTIPDRSHTNQIRYMLHLLNPVFLASNVQVIVNTHDHTAAPTPIIPANDQIRLAMPFILWRCSNFRFTNLRAPGVLAVQDIVTSTEPTIDLEDFSRVPNDMLELLISAVWHDQNWYNEVADMDTRFALAIESFDVQAFLQARFEILKLWLKFARKMKSRDHAKKGSFVLREWNHFRISPSYRLGLKITEEGERLNSRLVNLKEQHKVMLFVDRDTMNRILRLQKHASSVEAGDKELNTSWTHMLWKFLPRFGKAHTIQAKTSNQQSN